MNRSRLPLLIALLSLSILLPTQPLHAQKWIEIHSPHFTVATDAGDKRARDVALHFEQMRAVFGQMILKDKVNISVPLEIIAFRTSKEFRQYSPIYQGKPVQLDGFFQKAEDRNYIALDLSGTQKWETVFHEYAHMLLNANYPPTQLWFDEGFAEYYSTINIVRDQVEIGKAPPGHIELLRTSRWIPIPDLFRVRSDSKMYNVGDPRSLFYGESWMVVHYIFDMHKMAEAGSYFDLVENQHVPVEQAIQQAFGMDPKQFERAVRDYSTSPKAVYRSYNLPLSLENMNTYTVKSLSVTDAQAMLADFDLHTVDYQERGIATLESVLKEQPQNAAAQRNLGFAYLYKNDLDRAAEHFGQAAELSSQDPWVHYYSAVLRQRSNDTTPGDLERSKQDLKMAIKLNPQFADAYALLGVAEMQRDEMPAAIGHLTTAVQLSPRNEMYMANLGQCYLFAHKWDEASTILQRLKNSTDPKITEMANKNLEQLETARNSGGVREVRSPTGADNYTAPQWRPKEQPTSTVAKTSAENPERTVPQTGPVQFLKGTLLRVDCSSSPAAKLTIQAGPKTWSMSTSDIQQLVLIGADKFSCDWHNRKVAVNYRTVAAAQGTIVSLELQ
jgi:tetratricopeptide (TPR) repeat protein